MSNPHGSCNDCSWHTARAFTDPDGDKWTRHECWKDAGEPCARKTSTNKEAPPACECHLKCKGLK